MCGFLLPGLSCSELCGVLLPGLPETAAGGFASSVVPFSFVVLIIAFASLNWLASLQIVRPSVTCLAVILALDVVRNVKYRFIIMVYSICSSLVV